MKLAMFKELCTFSRHCSVFIGCAGYGEVFHVAGKAKKKLPWDNYTDTKSNNRKSTVEITLQEFMYGHQ